MNIMAKEVAYAEYTIVTEKGRRACRRVDGQGYDLTVSQRDGIILEHGCAERIR